MIIGVGIVEGHERFDGNTAPHGHFVCNHCGRVIDIENDHVSPATIKLVTEELDVQIRNHELTFYGRCSHCK